MPLTPFMGLSVLVHLIVIAWHKVLSWFPKRAPRVKTEPSKLGVNLTKAMSLAIIAGVFLVVLANAAFLLTASFDDQYSSIHLAENYFGTKNLTPQYMINVLAGAKESTTTTAPIEADLNTCAEPYTPLHSGFETSIINYLIAKHYPYSFSSRAQLAAKVGIETYQGTAAQNQVLLTRLSSIWDGGSIQTMTPCKK